MFTWLKKIWIWDSYRSGKGADDLSGRNLLGSKLNRPSNLLQALRVIDNMFDATIRDELNQSEEDVVTKSHHEFGRWIRNNWGLWNDSSLCRWFKQRGIWHPDDMSTIIIRSYYRKQKGESIRFQEQVQHFIRYWTDRGEGKPISNEGFVRQHTKMYILVDDMSYNIPGYIWYVCELGYDENPDCDWVLSCTESQKKKDAMKFCKKKAERLATILSAQEDEEGYSSTWIVEEA